MRFVSMLSFALLSAACTHAPTCTPSSLGDVVVPDLPRGGPVDVDVLRRTTTDYAGAVALRVVDGTLPDGIALTGTHLVGSATATTITPVTFAIDPVDTSLCGIEQSVTIRVRERECVSDQACDARAASTQACTTSSDCAPFGGLPSHCVQVLEHAGVCVVEGVICSGGARDRSYVDTEGATFASCGSDPAPHCSASSLCE